MSRMSGRTTGVATGLGAAVMLVAAALAVLLAAPTGAGAAATHGDPGTARGNPGWVATWAASPQGGDTTAFTNQTVRNIMYTSVGGSAVRVRLSNTFGSGPVTVGATSVGVVLDGARLAPGTSHPVTFGGHSSVTIPAGQQVLSDPVDMRVPRLTELAIDVYLPSPTGPATYHAAAWQTNFVAPGDHAGQAAGAAYTKKTGSWYFADGVDVLNPATPGTVVAFGDSITDVGHSEVDSNARWPNYLSRRLDAALGNRAPTVVDAGISGNRVLNDSSCYGQSALARFRRDALSQSGAKAVVLLEGINDIGFSGEPDTGCYAPNDPTVTAAQIEAGYRRLITMAHARGIKIYAGTLTPFLGSNATYGGNYGTARGEALRRSVNHWIRTSHAFDGVVDFDRAVASPYDPGYLNPAYNSTGCSACHTGDSLHPNDLGDQVMADAIPLTWFAHLRAQERDGATGGGLLGGELRLGLPFHGTGAAVEDEQGTGVEAEAVEVAVELAQSLAERVAGALGADLDLDGLALDRVLAVGAGVGLADEDVDPAPPHSVLAIDAAPIARAPAVHDPGE
ncbi:MAG: SGNH/GDSL hydrolase family protein [Nocardiopsaceae bacterium]|nr:SGNH/GDSL hydrolase family protein [Nocardiopsaceae bacterium]